MLISRISPDNTLLKGAALVALSGILFGLMGYLGTQLFNRHFSVENMLFWRFFIASIWILLIAQLTQKKLFASNKKTPQSLFKFSIFATATYSGGSAFYFLASNYIGTGIAMVVFFSFPVFVSLFGYLLDGWRMTKHALLSLLAVIIGLLFLKGETQESFNQLGLMFALIAAISYAMYIYGNRHQVKSLDASLLSFLVCFGNAALFLTIAWYNQSFFIPHSLSAWGYIWALSIFATVLPIQLFLMGLKYISPVKASILSVLEPVITVLIGMLLLNESLTYIQVFGMVIVLVGAISIQFENTKKE